jgi:nicotinate-nucleotide adenylyltransferase
MTVIAVFGSAFNPPHLGHMDVVRQCLPHVDQVLIVPSAQHPFGKKMAAFDLRLKMLRIILQETFNNPDNIIVSRIENTLRHSTDKPIYSHTLLCSLLADALSHGQQAEYRLVLGPDNLEEQQWSRFFRHQDITQQFGVLAVKQRLAVRSTPLRALLQRHNTPPTLQPQVGQKLGKFLCQNNPYV